MNLGRFWFIASGSFLIVFLALGLVVFLVPDSAPRGVFGLVTESEASGDFVAISGECALVGDNPPCGSVDLREIVSLINLWARGGATLSDVVKLINQWAEPVPITTTTSTTITSTTSISTTTTTVPASITVLVPNGGETWQRGASHTVTWTYAGSGLGSYVKIALLKSGAEIGTIVASTSIGSGGNGSCVWNISSNSSLVVGSDFMVNVKSITQPAINDSSDAYFTLTPASTTTTTTTSTTTTSGGTGYLSDWSQDGTDMLPLLPANHIARVNISALPLDSRSSTWINAVATHGGGTGYLKAYMLLYIQYVGAGVPMQTFYFDRETIYRPSDHVPYALPIDYMPELTSSDSKMFTLDRDTRTAYEMSYVDNCMGGESCTHPMGRYPNGTYVAGGGVVYNLSNLSVHQPLGTSGVIVSGMQQIPLILSRADIESGSVDHALSLAFYAPGNTNSATDYMWPASATAYSSSYPTDFPKHGARVRLKANYDISGFSRNNQIVLQGLKTYGGFFTITSGTDGIRIIAEKEALNSTDNNQLMAAGNALLWQFEFINETSLMISPTSYEAG